VKAETTARKPLRYCALCEMFQAQRGSDLCGDCDAYVHDVSETREGR
jgi:hypothetical protein